MERSASRVALKPNDVGDHVDPLYFLGKPKNYVECSFFAICLTHCSLSPQLQSLPACLVAKGPRRGDLTSDRPSTRVQHYHYPAGTFRDFEETFVTRGFDAMVQPVKIGS